MNQNLKEHQQVLYEMLCVVDSICRKYHIHYQLFAGTALGAVRHRGFIPWDDDLDILMMREDYERFLEVAQLELDQDVYFLQKEFSEHWPMTFSKLRKNGTTCIERYIPKDEHVHQGVYIDLFPCDSLSDSVLIQKLQFLVSKVVIAKALGKRGYLTDSFAKKALIFVSGMIPDRKLIEFVKMNKKTTKKVHSFFGASSRFEKSIYLREWIEESEEIQFEGGCFPVTKHTDAMLKCLYGDYMRIPDEQERVCKVHGEIVDLNRSYTEYLGIQKTMKFKEYTRSIR